MLSELQQWYSAPSYDKTTPEIFIDTLTEIQDFLCGQLEDCTDKDIDVQHLLSNLIGIKRSLKNLIPEKGGTHV